MNGWLQWPRPPHRADGRDGSTSRPVISFDPGHRRQLGGALHLAPVARQSRSRGRSGETNGGRCGRHASGRAQSRFSLVCARPWSAGRRCDAGDRGAAVLRPDQAMERPDGPCADQHARGKRGRTSNVPPKRSGFPGEDREPRRSDGTSQGADQSERTAAALPSEHAPVGIEALANPSAPGTAMFPVTRTSVHRVEIRQPIVDEARPLLKTSARAQRVFMHQGARKRMRTHPSSVAAANRSDAEPAIATRSRFRGANTACALEAAPATRTAPVAAKTMRRLLDGAQICASQSVVWLQRWQTARR